MPEARLQLEIPDHVWMGELTREYPSATFRVVAVMPDEGRAAALTEVTSSHLDELLERMRGYEMVCELTELNRDTEHALVQFETTLPLLLLPARNSRMPLETPFEVTNATAVWELRASRERLSELADQLDEFCISFTVDYIQYEVGEEQLLTASQEEILEHAIQMGYYDTPRECSLTDLAEEVGRAKSTISETLHRAEGKIIKEHADVERTAEQPATPFPR